MGQRSLREGAGGVGPTPAAAHGPEGVSRLRREKRDAVVLVGPLGESGEVRWLAAVIQCQRGESCPENTDQLRWFPGAAGGRLARARLGRGV